MTDAINRGVRHFLTVVSLLLAFQIEAAELHSFIPIGGFLGSVLMLIVLSCEILGFVLFAVRSILNHP